MLTTAEELELNKHIRNIDQIIFNLVQTGNTTSQALDHKRTLEAVKYLLENSCVMEDKI